jgi:hypothetical protein
MDLYGYLENTILFNVHDINLKTAGNFAAFK